jgi:HSP20 family molecular chaperone IbpA
MTGENWDDFDEEAIEEMARMFEQMGMPIDINTLKSMIKQVRSQFEEMGIDPEKVSMSEVKLGLNSDPEEFMKNFESMISGPQGLGDFLKKMGVDIHIKPSVSEVRVDVDESQHESKDDSIPEEDVYVNDGQMFVTIDVSKFDDVSSENLELSLTGEGVVIQMLRTNQIRPFRTFVLPNASSGVANWEINNGILDITFELK